MSESTEPTTFRVPIDGFVMQLRRWELEPVASGLAELPADGSGRRSRAVSLEALAAALCEMPPSDRAPVWELAVRHFGRRKPLRQAAGEIGVDTIRGQALIAAFSEAVARVAPTLA